MSGVAIAVALAEVLVVGSTVALAVALAATLAVALAATLAVALAVTLGVALVVVLAVALTVAIALPVALAVALAVIGPLDVLIDIAWIKCFWYVNMFRNFTHAPAAGAACNNAARCGRATVARDNAPSPPPAGAVSSMPVSTVVVRRSHDACAPRTSGGTARQEP